MMQKLTIEDLMISLSKTMENVFFAEKTHLWMADADTGIFYTYGKKS